MALNIMTGLSCQIHNGTIGLVGLVGLLGLGLRLLLTVTIRVSRVSAMVSVRVSVN